jgi:hypothetical protein
VEVTVASMTTGGPERVRAIPRYLVAFFLVRSGAIFIVPRFGGCSDRSIISSKIRFTFTFTSRDFFDVTFFAVITSP